MIDVVIPLMRNTPYNCSELKYALRSLDNNLSKLGNVFIVGEELPDWITNVELIFSRDYLGKRNKEYNIASKFCSACLDKRVSNPFIASNDDVYLLEKSDAYNYPYFYFGAVYERLIKRKPNEIYYASLQNTINALGKHNRNMKYFDLHCPIRYEKEQFLRIIKMFNWRNNCGYVIKSLYSNLMSIEGELYPDLKLKPGQPFSLIEGRKFFSNGNLVIKDGLFDVLEKLFPFKSRFEV